MAEQIEAAKKRAAERAVADHFDPSFRYVGIGSGTTIIYVVEAIKATFEKHIAATTGPERRGSLDPSSMIQFVPTGYQSRQVIVRAGLTPIAFDSLPENMMLDVAFDGADEVDDELNCIKGGGACLFQEKLVATKAKKFVCVADYRKDQSRLLTNWPSIPIEVVPIAVYTAVAHLRALGSTDPKVRAGLLAKSGPDQTDQGNFIIDAKFPGPLLTKKDVLEARADGRTLTNGQDSEGRWEVDALAREIKSITGVLDVGLFVGENGYDVSKRTARGEKAAHGLEAGQKPVSCYFGMQDGSVRVKEAKVNESTQT